MDLDEGSVIFFFIVKIIGCFMIMMTISITIFPGIGNKKIYRGLSISYLILDEINSYIF